MYFIYKLCISLWGKNYKAGRTKKEIFLIKKTRTFVSVVLKSMVPVGGNSNLKWEVSVIHASHKYIN